MKFNKSLVSVGVAAIIAASASAQAADSLSPAQVKQVQQVVHDYLVSDPQVLVEASQALQKQEMAKAVKNAQGAIVQNGQSLFADPASPVAGNPKGNVTVIEFFDYQCPHCKDTAPAIDKIIQQDKNVRVVFKELPIFGGASVTAAQAALAAYKQGADKFYQFHKALMQADNPLTDDKIMDIAKSVGLNVDQLKTDMNDASVQAQIDKNLKLAKSLGILGTPTFVISKWEGGSSNTANLDKAAFIPGAASFDTLQETVKKQSS